MYKYLNMYVKKGAYEKICFQTKSFAVEWKYCNEIRLY